MIKLIGSALVILGTAAWGFSGVHRLRQRASNLSALTSSLELMKSEISDRLTPMPELLNMLSITYRGAVSLFYGRVSHALSEGETALQKAWRDSLDLTPELLLEEDERSALLELGLSLGKYNAGEQSSAIEYTRRRLSSFAEKAQTRRDSECKMHAFLGVAAGIFAVLLLV